MILYLIVLLILAAGIFWLGQTVLANPGITTITWGVWSLEMKTATLVALVLLTCIVFYIGIALLRHVLGLRRNFSRYREARLGSKASRALSQGLIQLTEGHWEKAEKLLTEHAPHSDTPLLNYLAAARAAHMQEAYTRRDELLKQAIESDSKANIAVGVSQADMQMTSGQLEQAHATLTRLRELSPKHPYVLKLLAKVLYRQEHWDTLLELLPELVKQNLLKNDDMGKVQGATLAAMFQQHAKAKHADKLQALWKKLPSVIRENPEAILLYARALHTAGDDLSCASLISNNLNKRWDDGLADLYGRIQHHSLGNAIQQAEKWQLSRPDNNPALLLLLARLYNQQKLWGMAKSYYESSLNQTPNTQAYLELAELLDTMKEPENAQRCYRLGLRYCIRGEGEKLSLTPTQRPQATPQAQPVLTPYNGL
ncbi:MULTISPECIES: heme biosynthesis HemY N-terminal domain-containing protein [Thiothrix]|jgi:HemY protein|uniref:Tetratricopeptide repeat protein n=2 Tax=Thiothrix TaxID=1030 RepID=A0A975F8H4_9GAMM|nr:MULTISPECIES: heme biosynthesis HemY N-terminal domain-containing protein [Thiothrix]MDX9987334.1 heme biosynthesis HemY N-terminal domain-containing protein [Thiothrix unzii]OQX06411.1 MAG: heme biosynthesis protein HemY [Thiothrix lacustris]QTR53147.1 tetratricopeptide repeat protein [Thiothrix unzii]